MLAERPGADAPVCAAIDPRDLPDDERYRRFGEELDAVKHRVHSRIGLISSGASRGATQGDEQRERGPCRWHQNLPSASSC